MQNCQYDLVSVKINTHKEQQLLAFLLNVFPTYADFFQLFT